MGDDLFFLCTLQSAWDFPAYSVACIWQLKVGSPDLKSAEILRQDPKNQANVLSGRMRRTESAHRKCIVHLQKTSTDKNRVKCCCILLRKRLNMHWMRGKDLEVIFKRIVSSNKMKMLLIDIDPAGRKTTVEVFNANVLVKKQLLPYIPVGRACHHEHGEQQRAFLGAQPPPMIKCSRDSHSRLPASMLFLASALLVAVQLSSRVQTPARGADIYNCHSCLHRRETPAQKLNDFLFLLAQDLSSPFSVLPSSSPKTSPSRYWFLKEALKAFSGGYSSCRGRAAFESGMSCFQTTLRVITQILLESCVFLHHQIEPHRHSIG